MFSSIFNADNSFWQRFARVMDLFGLSLCWLFCSLPLVTLGASTTALYDAVYHGVRRGESRDYDRFFTTFRRELKTSFLVTLPMLALTAAFLLLYRTAYVMMLAGSQAGGVLFYTYRLLFCIPLAVWLFACALLSRFTFTPGALLRTACQLVFAHLPSAVLMIVTVILLLSLVIWRPISCVFVPASAAWLCSFPLERIFAPFLNKDESGT